VKFDNTVHFVDFVGRYLAGSSSVTERRVSNDEIYSRWCCRWCWTVRASVRRCLSSVGRHLAWMCHSTTEPFLSVLSCHETPSSAASLFTILETSEPGARLTFRPTYRLTPATFYGFINGAV